MKVVSFKALEEDYRLWQKEAKESGITFGEWARRRLNDGLIPAPVAPTLAALAQGVTETLMEKVQEQKILQPHKCPHRLPPGTYCKVCERIKK